MNAGTQDFAVPQWEPGGQAAEAPVLRSIEPKSASDVDASAGQLAQVRLGMASSLFTALQLRHAPSASHSLRVALICSKWSQLTEMSAVERDELEVAALLHDIGKIGIPDPVLKKPSALSAEQAASMRKATPYGLAILRSCCCSENVLKTVEHVHTWFEDSEAVGGELPLASRMIAIVDAFDAMTTDRIYRKAMPRERAVAELFEAAGSQFDPNLVAQFATLQGLSNASFFADAANSWLEQLSLQSNDRLWQLQQNGESANATWQHRDFFEAFLSSSRDAVIFIDGHLSIVRWNMAAEKLTGVASEQIMDCTWVPQLVGMKDSQGNIVNAENCPVTRAIRHQARSAPKCGHHNTRRKTCSG